MTLFILRRLLSSLFVALLSSIIIFTVLQVLPGDPAQIMLGINADPSTLASLRNEMGLNRPLVVRYFDWLFRFLTGDLGISYTYHVPVIDLVRERLAISIPLAGLALLLSLCIAIPAGIYAAAHHQQKEDFITLLLAQVGVAVPNFWLGLLLILLFSVYLGWFPSTGFAGWSAPGGVWQALHSLSLPVLSLVLPQAAILFRITRSALLDTLQQDFIRTARAKGLSHLAVLWRHALPHAMIPIVTLLGLQLSFLLSGTIIIESVFSLPGIGRLIFQAVTQRDLIVVQNIILLLTFIVIFVNVLVDLSYRWIHPQIRDYSHDKVFI